MCDGVKMSLTEKILCWRDSALGTNVRLPDWAVEVQLSRTVLEATKAGGWCMHSSYIDRFVYNVLSTPAYRHVNSREMAKLFDAIDHKDKEKFTHIIILPKCKNPMWTALRKASTTAAKKSLLRRNALINHERMHAWLMHKTNEWHVFVDAYMGKYFGEEWDACITALLSNGSTYNEITKQNHYDPIVVAWQATEEILARIASVDHAPAKYRKWIAMQELKNDPNALISLYKKIKNHWDSIEHFIGWMDSSLQHYKVYYGLHGIGVKICSRKKAKIIKTTFNKTECCLDC